MKKLLVLAFCAVFLAVCASCAYVVINKEEIPTPEMALELTAILDGISYGPDFYDEFPIQICVYSLKFLRVLFAFFGYPHEWDY